MFKKHFGYPKSIKLIEFKLTDTIYFFMEFNLLLMFTRCIKAAFGNFFLFHKGKGETKYITKTMIPMRNSNYICKIKAIQFLNLLGKFIIRFR